ncbi:MAG: hypothetical protein JXA61_00150 [Bacteroidales bacterium]|nr:hypothetical protein [Bacteroidales bacterium]
MRHAPLLMNDLYFPELTGKEEGRVTATIRLRENHDIFKGHFPGNPILPGVCLIQIIKELMGEALKKQLQLTEAGNIKYLAFINPHVNNTLNIEIQYKTNEEGEFSCNSRVFDENRNYCSFRGAFKVHPEGLGSRRGVRS